MEVERAWAPAAWRPNGTKLPPPTLHHEGRALRLTVVGAGTTTCKWTQHAGKYSPGKVAVYTLNKAVALLGTVGCPSGASIDSDDDCRTAAAALDLPFGTSSTYSSSSSYPKGCFVYGKQVYMNTHITGRTSPYSSYGQVCKSDGRYYTVTPSATKCSTGDEADTEADCKRAAAWLPNFSYGGSQNSATYPKGCFSSGSSIYTNFHRTGRTFATSSYGKVCKPMSSEYKGFSNTNVCPSGSSAITTAADCQFAAANMPGRTYDGQYISHPSYPTGCFSASKIHWNSYPYGSASGLPKVCKMDKRADASISLADAKAACIQTPASCKAVTCSKYGSTDCSPRTSATLLTSSDGETTHTSKCVTVRGSVQVQENKMGMLAKLAKDAGFDYINYADERFIYVSVLPDSCQTKVDLMFILDYSGSIASTGFHVEKNFAKDVVRYFDIGPDATRVARSRTGRPPGPTLILTSTRPRSPC